MLGFINLFCSLTCRLMSQLNVMDTVNNERNADDQPDEEWQLLEMHQLEAMRGKWQHLLRTIKQGHKDKLRLQLERLGKYIEKRRQPESKQWLNQVRAGAA